MAETKALHDALVDELRDLYHAEKQLVRALPKMARAAGRDELRDALENHLAETEHQLTRLEQVFEQLEERPAPSRAREWPESSREDRNCSRGTFRRPSWTRRCRGRHGRDGGRRERNRRARSSNGGGGAKRAAQAGSQSRTRSAKRGRR